ncbi:MAG TPA: S41 family peptidase [Opitutales bacterium]|jgi:carboxyl-terminal processing protease|nr:S41 family peptidase [Opitutales bacterium]
MLQLLTPNTVPRSPNLFKRVFLPVLFFFLLTAFLVRMAFDATFVQAFMADGKIVRGMMDSQFWKEWWRIGRVMELSHQNYLQIGNVTYDKLADSALDHILDGLDRYSDYMTPAKYQSFLNESNQTLIGIGVELERRNGHIQVLNVFSGSPAYKSGWQPGDRILEIDGTDVRDFTVAGVDRLLRGPEGKTVSVTRERLGDVPFTRTDLLTRGGFDVPSIRDFEFRTDNVGRLRITQFGQKTGDEFVDALRDMMGHEGLRGIILDLRDNSGGVLTANVEVKMLQTLLKPNMLIVTTKGRSSSDVQTLVTPSATDPNNTDPASDLHYDGPLVVLVNEGTASAAEIVAGALQDHSRAIIVGQRTYGKGVVQSILPLGDGGAVRLTTEAYLLPKNESIQDVGIVPDIRMDQTTDERDLLRAERADLRHMTQPTTSAAFAAAYGFDPSPDPEIETAAGLILAASASK